jgi:sec-independent protein translocase protein TatC
MPLLDHLMELRTRLLISIVCLIVAFLGCMAVAEPIFNWLVQPLHKAMQDAGGSTNRLIFTQLTEGFLTRVRVALFAGGMLTFPIFATQMWRFIAPGLYRHEKRALVPFLLASPILFFFGAGMVYYFIMPMAWKFLLGFQVQGGDGVMPVQLEQRVGEYLSLVMQLMFAFGLAFQFPVLLVLMAKVGIISAKALREKRRYAIVGVFIFAAVVTPPDVFSQVGLAIPMLVLYELSIIGATWVEKQRDAAQTANASAAGVEDTDFNES